MSASSDAGAAGEPGYGAVLALTIALAPLIATHKSLFVSPSLGHLPAYYVIYGLAASAITAITEGTLVNGYLLIRLEQLGWDPSRALVFSLILRTSYHVYYGLGFVLTIPLGYFLTRSFQKHRRLMRPILAHFIYDAVLFTIAVLASGEPLPASPFRRAAARPSRPRNAPGAAQKLNIRQLTDVSRCKLQQDFPCNRHRAARYAPGPYPGGSRAGSLALSRISYFRPTREPDEREGAKTCILCLRLSGDPRVRARSATAWVRT